MRNVVIRFSDCLLPAAVVSMLLTGCAGLFPGTDFEVENPIPKQEDWIDYGEIFEAGQEGDWDLYLWGGFTNTAVKKDGVTYLYYQGASGYRTEPDETVVWRAIGAATSQDGINFTKYDQNPVITWFPSGYPEGNGEEGAVSGGVTLDEDGKIALYYGANTSFSQSLVHADGRLAISSDGFNFTDIGPVLKHDDRSLWGSGDELFPIAAIQDAGQWIVYYLPNGLGIGRKLGVAWGDAPDKLDQSARSSSGLFAIDAWGTAGSAKVGPGTYAIFTNWVTEPKTEARLMSLEAPNRLSDPIEVYRFDNVSQATIILDEVRRTWFMYYRTQGGEGYGVMLAPAGPVDQTPPIPPANLKAEAGADGEIDLSWDPATDYETGIVQYKVFRDGQEVATVKGLRYVDSNVEAETNYQYTISAVNYHGQEGEPSKPILGTTH